MDRLVALLEQFSSTEAARLVRRAAYCSIVAGAVGLGVTAATGHALVGLGISIGLVLGLVNIGFLTRAIARLASSDVATRTSVIVTRAVYRIALTTIVVIALLLASTTIGVSTAGGIAVFYFLFGANLIRALFAGGHHEVTT